MAKPNMSRIPNFKTPAQSRAIITGMVATTLGVAIGVPVYNKFIAPLSRKAVESIKAAGFLPSA